MRKKHPPSPLIEQLRQARIEQGLTQTEVGDAMGTCRSNVQNWENRFAEPLLSSAEAWARVLGRRLAWEPVGVDLSALLGELADE